MSPCRRRPRRESDRSAITDGGSDGPRQRIAPRPPVRTFEEMAVEQSVDPASRNRAKAAESRPKTRAPKREVRQQFQRDSACPVLPLKIFVFLFFRNCACLWPSRLMQGAYARSSRYVECGNAVDVSSCSVIFHADERPDAYGQVVWSWHPGADACAMRFAHCRDAMMLRITRTGARKPVPEESTKQPLRPSRGEGRDVSADPVVTAACFSFCRRAMGAASSRPSLHPLPFRG